DRGQPVADAAEGPFGGAPHRSEEDEHELGRLRLEIDPDGSRPDEERDEDQEAARSRRARVARHVRREPGPRERWAENEHGSEDGARDAAVPSKLRERP